MQFTDQVFDGGEVPLDGNSYSNCTFRNVTLQYAGGDLDMTDCALESFRLQFFGDLERGLFTLYQLFGEEGLVRIIRGFGAGQADEQVTL